MTNVFLCLFVHNSYSRRNNTWKSRVQHTQTQFSQTSINFERDHYVLRYPKIVFTAVMKWDYPFLILLILNLHQHLNYPYPYMCATKQVGKHVKVAEMIFAPAIPLNRTTVSQIANDCLNELNDVRICWSNRFAITYFIQKVHGSDPSGCRMRTRGPWNATSLIIWCLPTFRHAEVARLFHLMNQLESW